MSITDAMRRHVALAYVLLPQWDIRPTLHHIIAEELGRWQQHAFTTDDQFFAHIQRVLQQCAAPAEVVRAVAIGASAPLTPDPLDTLFATLLSRVRSSYTNLASWGGTPVHFDRTTCTNPPLPDVGTHGELACVARVSDTGGNRVVILQTAPSLLGPPSLASIPYVLCHELVCHAAQTAAPDAKDPFTEGWMDVVALTLHNRWIRAVFPQAPDLALEYGPRLASMLRQMPPTLNQPHITTRAARRQGAAAAAVVNKMLTNLRPHRSSPATSFIALSLQLNRVPATSADHTLFVANVNEQAETDLPSRTAGLAVALRDWLAGANASAVLYFR